MIKSVVIPNPRYPANSTRPWVCRWWIPNGTPKPEQHQKAFLHPGDAANKAAEMDRRITGGEFDSGRSYTFGEAALHYIQLKPFKAGTKARLQKILKLKLKRYADMPLHEVAELRAEIHGICESEPQGETFRSLFSGVCDMAVAEGVIPSHRLGRIILNKKTPGRRGFIPMSPEQFATLIDHLPESLRLAGLIMRGCGLRTGEALALHVSDFHDGIVEIKREWSGGRVDDPKLRKIGFVPRQVPVPYWLELELKAHIARYCTDSEKLFASRTVNAGIYYSQGTFNIHWRKAALAAGLPHGSSNTTENFVPYQMRKHWSTDLRANLGDLGLNYDDLEEWLGHKKLSRDVYAFIDRERIERARKLSDPRLRIEK